STPSPWACRPWSTSCRSWRARPPNSRHPRHSVALNPGGGDGRRGSMPTPWWQTAVIYQIYPRSLQDTNADGIGDLEGIIRRLPHLVELGVDAIWLSPIFPSPMADFGYDITDYTDIAPIFGSMADFDRLLHAVHGHGLRLLLDFVPNHTSDQHPWFHEARASRHNP